MSSPRAAQMDLTNPSTVPGGVPASSEGQAHPTVRSHRSHAQAPVSSGSTSATAPEEAPSRRPHTTHRFQGPGIPAPAEEAETPASRRERRDAAQAPAGSRTSSTASTSRRSGARTGDSTAGAAGSMTNAAAPTSAPAAVSHPTAGSVPAVSAQAATPSLPSASSAAPALSVRLVPLLGGNPILIHEPTVVGRDPDNISAYPGAERVALDDPTRSVSKTHAAIFPLLDGVWVTDLHSTNGTRVEAASRPCRTRRCPPWRAARSSSVVSPSRWRSSESDTESCTQRGPHSSAGPAASLPHLPGGSATAFTECRHRRSWPGMPYRLSAPP